MKKHFRIIGLLFVALAFSCQKSEQSFDNSKVQLTPDEMISLSFTQEGELTEKQIVDIASSFSAAQSDGPSTRSSSSFNVSGKKYINLGGEFDDIATATRSGTVETASSLPIYEVEVSRGDEKGMAYVSGDARFPSVIAFIPEVKHKNSMDRTGAAELLHAAKATHLYKFIKAKNLADSLRSTTLSKISEKLKIDPVDITYDEVKDRIEVIGAITRTTAVPRQPPGVQKLSSSIAPYVKVKWGQGAPYNGRFWINDHMDWVLREDGNGQEWGAVPVGCVNIAIGQMLSYTHCVPFSGLQFPNPERTIWQPYEINLWLEAQEYPTLKESNVSGWIYFAIQDMLNYLYETNGTYSKKDWAGVVTDSAVDEDDLLSAMSRYFRYDSKTYFDGDLAWAALRNKNIMLMLATDHVFIISGMLITYMANPTRQLVQTNDVYWHANFGWSNDCDGYYQLDKNARVYFEAGSVAQWDYQMNFLNNVRKK